jgi:hypothetical protein
MSRPNYAPRMRLMSRTATVCPGRERGSIAIMTIGALVAIIAFCGLALDL